jgi:hypothetical protein
MKRVLRFSFSSSQIVDDVSSGVALAFYERHIIGIRAKAAEDYAVRQDAGASHNETQCLVPAGPLLCVALEFCGARGRFGSRELVELVELALEEFFGGEKGLVIGNQGRGDGSAQSVLDHFAVFACAEEDADGRAFVRFPEIAVQGFEIKLHFAQVLGLEAFNLKVKSDEAPKATMVEEKVEVKVFSADG